MAELRLAPPKHIHEAVPANMACGRAYEAGTGVGASDAAEGATQGTARSPFVA